MTLEKKILSCFSRNNVRLGCGLRWNVITGEEGVPYQLVGYASPLEGMLFPSNSG